MKSQIVVRCSDCTPDDIRDIMERTGSRIGNVHFVKRSDGSLRKMCYRLHVSRPQYGPAPSSFTSKGKRVVDVMNNQMTVYDVNKVLRDSDGNIIRTESGKTCRGAYRTVPLEKVKRIVADGIIYEILD